MNHDLAYLFPIEQEINSARGKNLVTISLTQNESLPTNQRLKKRPQLPTCSDNWAQVCVSLKFIGVWNSRPGTLPFRTLFKIGIESAPRLHLSLQ